MKPSLRRGISLALALGLLLAGAAALRAERTRRWRQTSYENFLKGTARGIAVRSDGHLELAPRIRLIADADASYLWSLRLDGKGGLYAAGGSPAKVFRFDAAGKPSTLFESTELSAQAIAFDGKGGLYVGTSPDGKVYHVTAQGEKSVFFEPKTKYIWDLVTGPDGTLYVATGDKGQIFAVAPGGKSELFYASDEAHIRVLALDGRGNLLAGTEPSGRILRIALAAGNPERGAFVLQETSKREVTALLVAPDGSIYAAAIGEKPRPTPAGAPQIQTPPQMQLPAGAATGIVVSSGGLQMAAPFTPFPQLISSSIYRLAPDGAPEEIWSSREETVYSLGLNSDGRVLAGTGNKGALLVIDGRGVFAQLAKSGSAQITGLARAADGKVYLCTANPGKVFSAGPEFEPEGTFESQSFDAQLFTQWGRIEWWGPPPANAAKQAAAPASAEPRISFYARSGNTEDPGREWSPWSGPYTTSGETVQAPPARFVQWKAVLRDARPGAGIDWVSIAYLPRNVAPVIDAIVVQDPGVRVQGAPSGSPMPGQTPVNLKLPPASNAPASPFPQPLQRAGVASMEAPPQAFAQKGYRSVLWSTHDDNDDELRYAVYYRGEAETQWKLLKEGLEQRHFSWDTTAFPDGAYYLKIIATDVPSNPPALALTASRESERFEVDNTPPAVEQLRAEADTKKGAAMAHFLAHDAASGIDRAQYSLDGGEWTLVAPVGGISDAPEERYELPLTGLSSGEHTLALRAYDRFENVGSAKIVFSLPGAKP
ncbi:MAG: hypothetical protein LAN61_15190 [Acidobacteriia bacterium]|nr:hypothetical protein [Terriglobia bacterium]